MAAIDPVGALLRWLNAIDPPARALIGCAHAALPPVSADAIGVRLVGCVVDAGVDLPAQLLAAGIGRVEVVACPERPGAAADRTREWVRTLDGVAAVAADPHRRGHRSGPTFDLAHPALPRRLALGLGEPPLRLPFDPALPERDRALAALRVLADAGRAHLPESAGEEGDPAATLLAASGCTACGVCVRACPHDALVLDLADGVSTLRHLRDACRGDLACVRLCPERALAPAGVLTLLDVAREGTRELAAVSTRACRRCGTQHPVADGELCPTCTFRATSAFGSRLPPGTRPPG